MPWYIHLYQYVCLALCIALGYYISYWIPLLIVAAVVFYGMKY